MTMTMIYIHIYYIYTHPNSTEVGLKVFSEQVTTSSQLENQATSVTPNSQKALGFIGHLKGCF